MSGKEFFNYCSSRYFSVKEYTLASTEGKKYYVNVVLCHIEMSPDVRHIGGNCFLSRFFIGKISQNIKFRDFSPNQKRWDSKWHIILYRNNKYFVKFTLMRKKNGIITNCFLRGNSYILKLNWFSENSLFGTDHSVTIICN